MKTDLSSTSALVLLWADGDIHTSSMSKKFLDMLNLESGEEVLKQCDCFWPHYSEILKNRKSCILGIAKNNVSIDSMNQMVVLGSGFDALSLEVYSHAQNCKIFEIDAKNMDTKQDLIKTVNPSASDAITCITLDLSDYTRVVPVLVAQGWDPNIPTLIIIEGLSYYLSKDALWGLIGEFKTQNQTNRIVLEYLLPPEMIPSTWSKIAAYPFDLIATGSRLPFISRYDIAEISSRLSDAGGKLVCRHSMRDMEKRRTLQNRLFFEHDGWIEICEFLA